MSSFEHVYTTTEVVDPVSFARYAQQSIGTKYPTGNEWSRLKGACGTFFEHNPRATWLTLVHTVGYARAKRIRVATPWGLLRMVPQAFKDGFLPELDPRNFKLSDSNVEGKIAWILEHETDEWWVRALTFATGVEPRRNLVQRWDKLQVSGA
jgi:hypothetical protein